jgi:hypothetical protein
LKIDIIVRGSVGDMRAPKYRVSKNVKDVERCGINCTNPYIRALRKENYFYSLKEKLLNESIKYIPLLINSIKRN